MKPPDSDRKHDSLHWHGSGWQGAGVEYHLEDLPVGTKLRSARRVTVTRDRLLAFAEEFDPQPAHLGDEQAAASHFGVLCASGWHTAAISMRLMVETMPVPGGGIGAGIEALNWLRPVLPGDSLGIEVEVLDSRASRSRPDKGIVRFRMTTLNQDEQPVQVLTAHVLVPRRQGDA